MCKVTSQMPRQYPRLHEWQPSNRQVLIEERVLQYFALPFLVRLDHQFPTFFSEFARASLAPLEMLEANLLPINQGHREPVREPGTKFLHEVERQRRSVRTVDMEKPDERIQTGAR